ncbi:MAG: hypothetical protein ACLR6J_01370 [Parabacteroides merdae]
MRGAIEDIARSVTLLWIGCRRDNGFAVRPRGDLECGRLVRGWRYLIMTRSGGGSSVS